MGQGMKSLAGFGTESQGLEKGGMKMGKTQKDVLEEITARLEQGILELFNSERFREYLRVMSQFHRYSLRNTILIAMQKPDATRVAGFLSEK